MQGLKESILATLIYYDNLGMPLTLVEVYKFLINPRRLNSNFRTDVEIKLSETLILLDSMVTAGEIGRKNGFYFLPGKVDLYGQRIESEKILASKWKKMVRKAYWLQSVPFLRGLLASGSMAVGNVNEQSDWDILTITESNRIYTTRIFLSLVASMLRVRRKRHDKIAADKFCFNHYLTKKDLELKHQSLFNAQTYIALKPIFISKDLFQNFFRANTWLEEYIYKFEPSFDFEKIKIKQSRILGLVANFLELILGGGLGDWLESRLKNYQQGRIRNNPVSHESGGRVIFNDLELEFHPHSFEALVIKEYNQKLAKLGIKVLVEEKDSGLY